MHPSANKEKEIFSKAGVTSTGTIGVVNGATVIRDAAGATETDTGGDGAGGGVPTGTLISGGAAQIAIGGISGADVIAGATAAAVVGNANLVGAGTDAGANVGQAGRGAVLLNGGAAAAAGAAAGYAMGDANRAGGAGALQQLIVPSYQAMGQLFSATGVDVLAPGAAAIANANARAIAVVTAAAQARNIVQDLQRANVSYTDSIRQESMITHVLGGSIGYSFEAQPGFPVMLGLGGQYELPHSTNAGLESYKLFCKLGISF